MALIKSLQTINAGEDMEKGGMLLHCLWECKLIQPLWKMVWKVKVKVKSLSCVRLFVTPWTIIHKAPPSMGFSRQECWSGVPLCVKWASLVVLAVKNPPANAGDLRDVVLIPGLGISPGGGQGNSLQYPCLENPMDRGASWATVDGVTKSGT